MSGTIDPFRRKVLCPILAAVLLTGLGTVHAHADGHGAAPGTVLITGANRGLGLEFARQYQEAGWIVIGTARRPDQADELAALDVEVMPLDVTDQGSIEALAAALEGRPIDMLINNAGIFPRVSEIESVEHDAYVQTLMVNTVGPVFVTQALLPNLREGGQKRIVNISSRLGSIEMSSGGYYGYRESKSALNMWTKTLAAELGPEGFICLAIHPGWVRTDMGGPSADLSPEASVSGMRAVIDSVTADDNGSYRGYNGEPVAW